MGLQTCSDVGCEVRWQTRLEKASIESGEDVFYKFHCGAHRLNLVNGKRKDMEAVDATDSELIKSLQKIVKFTRKETNLIKEMGCQSLYHVVVRWSSLEVVLAWYRKHLDRLEAHFVRRRRKLWKILRSGVLLCFCTSTLSWSG